MRGSAATAGMLSAAILFAPGCGGGAPDKAASREEPVRRAAYKSLLARDLLAACPAGGVPGGESARYEELKRLASQRGAGHAIALGENDFASMRRLPKGGRCGAGDAARGAALAAYARTLDALAARIAEYRQ
ncbi:MAG TPA: hypothetical protein VMS43_07095 [Allosphingosinicella sp.]|nr:hypothetical protein [Allosphingosinicella sp.]